MKFNVVRDVTKLEGAIQTTGNQLRDLKKILSWGIMLQLKENSNLVSALPVLQAHAYISSAVDVAVIPNGQ